MASNPDPGNAVRFDPLSRFNARPGDGDGPGSPVLTERREAPRLARSQSAAELLCGIEPFVLALVVLQGLIFAALTGTVDTAGGAGLALLAACAIWAFHEQWGPARRTRTLPPFRSVAVRGVVVLVGLGLLHVGERPFWFGLWLATAAILYPAPMPRTEATLLGIAFAAGGAVLGWWQPDAPLLEAAMCAALFLLLSLLAHYIGASIDRQARAFSGMQVGEQRAQAIAANTDVMMIVVDRNFSLLQFNHAVHHVLGYDAEGFRAAWNRGLVHPADRRTFFRERRAVLRNPGVSRVFTARVRHMGGYWVWLELRVTNLLDNPAVRGIFASGTDITSRVVAESRLRHQAAHDPLTGLYNRGHFIEHLARAIEAARQTNAPLSLFFCDLDLFKTVNDQYGHDVGDRLLRALADRLRVRADAAGFMLSRFGGDEFVLLAPVGGTDAVQAVAQELLVALGQPVRIEDLVLQIEASIGVASLQAEHADPEMLIRDADAAMYQAKERGRNRIALFDDHLRQLALRKTGLSRALRGALRNEKLRVTYQPKVALAGGALAGFEVLIRWDNPEYGVIHPAEFIPLAEESGMIIPIGLWALRTASTQLAQWRRDHPAAATPVLAVNVSMRQLMHEDFVSEALRVIDEAGIAHDLLELEITESSAMVNPEQTVATLGVLKAAGLRLAIDDFGTGYSSLAWLRRLPVTAIKIDRDFVINLRDAGDALEILKLMIDLAHTLGLECIAEGIESRDQLARLRALACDFGQGYYFERPLTAHEAGQLLDRRPRYSVD